MHGSPAQMILSLCCHLATLNFEEDDLQLYKYVGMWDVGAT